MKPSNIEQDLVSKNIESAIKIAIVFIIIYTCFLIVKPFLLTVVWAIIIAIAFHPLHERLTKLLGNKNILSATVITLSSLTLLIAPIAWFMQPLAKNIKELAPKFMDGTFYIPPPPPAVEAWPLVGKPLSEIWQLFSNNIADGLERFSPQIQIAGEWLLGSLASLAVSVFIFFFAVIISGWFLAKSASAYKISVAVFTNLAGKKGIELVDNSKATISSVVNGVLGVAMIQSTLIAIGFFVADVPGAAILSLLVFFLAIVQLPPSLIVLPVVIYMSSVLSGVGAGVFIVWNIIAGFSDNILKPLLLGRGVKIPMLTILIGSIGGMLLMGIIGLFIGAVILALGYQIFQDWVDYEQKERLELTESNDEQQKGADLF